MSLESTTKKTIASTALAQNIPDFQSFLLSKLPQMKQVAARNMNPEQVLRVVVNCVSRTPALKSCTMISIYRSVMQSLELGLVPGSASKQAHLVPFGKECQLIPDYRGLILLAYRGGFVKSIVSYPVYQGDSFEFELGLEPKIKHVPNPTIERDPRNITYFYSVVKLIDDGVVYDVMTRGEVDAIRKRSKAGNNGPWVTDYAEMGRKTVLKRCLKYAPLSNELTKALAVEDAHESGDLGMLAEFTDLSDDLGEEEEPKPTKTESVKKKIGEVPDELTPEASALAYLAEIGMESGQILDYQATCQGHDRNWIECAQEARKQGADIEGAFGIAEGRLV